MISRKLGRGFSYRFIADPKVRENMEFIRKVAKENEKDTYPLFLSDEQTLLNTIFVFMSNLMEKDMTQDLNHFFRMIEPCDEIEESCVKFDSGKFRRVKRVETSDLTSFNDASVYLHEFVHFLNVDKVKKMYYDAMIDESLSILIQFAYGNFCDGVIQDELDVSLADAFISDRNDSDLIRTNPINEYTYDLNDPNILTTFKTFKYFISNVYAQRFYDFYLDDTKGAQKKLKGVLRGGMSADELFDYYGIDIANDDTVENVVTRIRKK